MNGYYSILAVNCKLQLYTFDAIRGTPLRAQQMKPHSSTDRRQTKIRSIY